MNTRIIGGGYEDLACKHMESLGHIIIARNFVCDIGELDIVTVQNGAFHFIEVKYRKDESFGTGAEAVSKAKLQKVYRIAEYFLVSNKLPMDLPCTVDIVSIQGEDIEYIENCYGVM